MLRILNLSEKYPAKLVSIKREGMDVSFNPWALRKIPPGETVELAFAGQTPEAHIKHASITIKFLQIGSPVPECKTFDFTILGG